MIFKTHCKLALFVTVCCLVLGPFNCKNALSYDFEGWGHGSAGYIYAMIDAEEKESPLILYFNMDSCEWSEKMNTKYLAPFETWEFLSNIPKVEINPERGEDENELCTRYGVTNFPCFLVFIPILNVKPQRIHPFSKGDDMTVEEFLGAIREKIAYYYNRRGHELFKNKEYEEALKYYELCLVFDPNNSYAYYALGLSYHSMSFAKEEPELLRKAKENYQKALEIDPKHQQSRDELKKVTNDMAKLGIK